jgi:predicted RNA-binding protein YlxR (DUF448 family)/ribosomal protein L30E
MLQTKREEDMPEHERTCVGCKKRDERGALLRLVLAGDPLEVVPDVRRGGAGRGASVHPSRACLDAAVKSGAIRRAFKRELNTDSGQIATWAREQYQRRIDGLIVAASRSGQAVVGTERVQDAIASRKVCMLIVADDAAESRSEVMNAAARLGGSCLVHTNKSHLGRLFNREQIAVVAVTDPAIAHALDEASRNAAALVEGT